MKKRKLKQFQKLHFQLNNYSGGFKLDYPFLWMQFSVLYIFLRCQIMLLNTYFSPLKQNRKQKFHTIKKGRKHVLQHVLYSFHNMTASTPKTEQKKSRKAVNVVHESLPQSKYFFLHKQLLALFTADYYFIEAIIELQGITGMEKKYVFTHKP